MSGLFALHVLEGGAFAICDRLTIASYQYEGCGHHPGRHIIV